MRMLNPSLEEDVDYLKYVFEDELGLNVPDKVFKSRKSILEFVKTCGDMGLGLVEDKVVVF